MSSKTSHQKFQTVLATNKRFALADKRFPRPQVSESRFKRPKIFDWQQPFGQPFRLILMLTLVSVIGCGSTADGLSRAAVNGFVSFDGEPLEAGVIRFIPSFGSEGPRVSVAIVNGFFRLTEENGPVVGQHRIEIEAPAAGDLAFDDEEALQRLRQFGAQSTTGGRPHPGGL